MLPIAHHSATMVCMLTCDSTVETEVGRLDYGATLGYTVSSRLEYAIYKVRVTVCSLSLTDAGSLGKVGYPLS